jgi:putative acetyltransferase
VIVRVETRADEAGARRVQVEAFRRPGEVAEPVEARLLDELRRCDGWIPELSLVAVDGVSVLGHVVTTRGFVDEVPVLGLGPIAVLPGHQRDGIGSALVRATFAAAEARGEALIALLGSPDYYGRFGFVAATSVGIEPPEPAWGRHFQVCPLAAHRPSITGRFRYAAPFDAL